jgi:hypothetical protein
VDDVASGSVKYLSGFSDVTSLLGAFPGTDPNPGFANAPWLFSDSNQGVLKVMEGSSASAVVCGDFGGWDVPPPLGTIRMRRLRVDIWTDPLRDANSNVTETSELTANRGMGVFNAVQFRLQRTDPDAVFWGDLCTVGCQLLTDIQFLPVTDGDWLLRGTAYYGVQFSGWADAAE